MPKMKAYQLVEWGKPPEFVDVDIPVPGENDVIIRMKGAGLCRSDIDIMDCHPETGLYASAIQAGFTLGHENAGVIEAVGKAVTDLKEGDHVVAHHMHSCGSCVSCLRGADQSCQTFSLKSIPLTRGVGLDGGLAPFMRIPRHEVVAIGALDPKEAAPLTDAGVTVYHPIKLSMEKLVPGAIAVVIGIGGLGSYAIQLLKLLTQVQVIAIDVSPQRLKLAKKLGADSVLLSNEYTTEQILEKTRGFGADVIFDIVGSDDTLALAGKISRRQGKIVLIGMEGGHLKAGWGSMAPNCEFIISNGSSRNDLYEICQLAADGKLRNDIEKFSFNDVELAYDRLRKGDLKGRAVVTFD